MTVKLNEKLVRHLLLEREISARELSKMAGIGEATIYRILSGESFNSVTLGKIAEALECNPVDLLDTGEFADPLVDAPTVDIAAG